MQTVPFAIDIRVPQRRIEVTAASDVVQEDRLTSIEEVCDLLDRHRDFAVLVDFRACPRTPSAAETYAIVSAVAARAQFFAGGVALLVRPGPPHGMACLEQLLARQAGVSFGVFTDRAEAECWLATHPHPAAAAPPASHARHRP